jgi:HlyD family secretion protein
MIKRLFLQVLRHKVISLLILALLIGGGVIWIRSRGAETVTKYVMGTATRGTVIEAISGSGQISSEREIDVTPTDAQGTGAEGKLTSVVVKQGQDVKAGDVLATIDQTEAEKTVRDAQRSVQDAYNSLKMAQLSLEETKSPADATDVLKSQNSLNSAKRALEDLKVGADASDVAKAKSQVEVQERKTRLSSDNVTPEVVREAYDQTIVDMRTLSQTLQSALQTVDSILGVDQISANMTYQQHLGVRYSGILDQAKSQYSTAKVSSDLLKKQTDDLKIAVSSKEDIEKAIEYIQKTITQTDTLLQTMQKVMDYSVTSASFSQSALDSLRSSINSARSSVTGKISAATDFARSIDDAQDSYEDALVSLQSAQIALDDLTSGADASEIASAEEKVKEAQAAYDDLMAGADSLDIKSAEQTVSQRVSSLASAQDSLAEAKKSLGNYTVTAPFDGVIASVDVVVGEKASASTVIATLITKVKLATLTLNEVDIVKVKKEQSATLTFDAIDDLTIVGTVAQVDLIGSANSGVVGYGVKIAFTTDDDRIKSGMSVSATIQTDVSADVVTVPNAAVQTDATGASYVLTLANVSSEQVEAASVDGMTSDVAPTRTTVTIGLVDDTNTEIISGLSAGDAIVVKTVKSSSKTAASTTGKTTTKGVSSILQGSTGGGAAAGGPPPGM